MVEHHAAGAKEGKTKAVETDEEHQVEVELNSILKKGPSKSTPPTHSHISFRMLHSSSQYAICNPRFNPINLLPRPSHSHNLLQNLLPALEKSQIDPPLQV